MDYLTLCLETCREAGMTAQIPQITTVTGATERPGQIVGWVRDAWIDIQNERTDWLFRILRAEKSLTIGQTLYTRTDLVLPRLARFIPDFYGHRTITIYDPTIGREDESEISFCPYERWLEMYDRGVHDASRPRDWSMSPQRELVIGPKPDKAYSIRFSYRATPQVLVNNTDEPELPEEFHRIIVFEAIRLMSRSDEAFAALQANDAEYLRLRSGLVIDQTPSVSM